MTTVTRTLNNFWQTDTGALVMTDNCCPIIGSTCSVLAEQFTLQDRDSAFTLKARDKDFTLQDRDSAFTLKDRDKDFTLQPRDKDFTVKPRN